MAIAETARMEAFDRAQALATFGSANVLREAARAYLEELDDMEGKLRSVVAQGDAEQIGERAHWVKGCLVYLHARPAADQAKRLEELAKEGKSELLESTLSDLLAEMTRLRQALEAEAQG